MRRVLVALLLAPAAALGAEVTWPLDRAPIDPRDLVSLQSGARTFVNSCLGCHGLQYMRYNRLTELGLTEEQIRENLMFTADKFGDPMHTAMRGKEAKGWLGVAPPDLSVIARVRGADWLYTYLRTFYRDPGTATGWNNTVFPNVAMPHALWTLQGEYVLDVTRTKGAEGEEIAESRLRQVSQGSQTPLQYDATVRDLVNFLVYVGEPAAASRKRIGIVVLFVLGALFVLAYALKKEYWKDVH